MVLRTLDAESLISWATISVTIGISVVVGSYPVRLGVFQYFPRFQKILHPKEAAGRFFTYQLFLLFVVVMAVIFLWQDRFDFFVLTLLCFTFVARSSFELLIDLLRAQESTNSSRVVSLYIVRSAMLLGGAAVLHVGDFEQPLLVALFILFASFLVPGILFIGELRFKVRGLLFFNGKNIRRIAEYLRYSIFLTIPFFVDAVILFIERYIYANLSDTSRVAEYFVWSDICRFYFNLVGILYLFEILPQALRRNSKATTAAESSFRQLFRKLFAITSLFGFIIFIAIKLFQPSLLLGAKESIASPVEVAAVAGGMWLWMYRMHILNIYFQQRRNTFGYFVLSVCTGIAFLIMLFYFERESSLSGVLYFLFPISNLLVISLFLIWRRFCAKERVDV